MEWLADVPQVIIVNVMICTTNLQNCRVSELIFGFYQIDTYVDKTILIKSIFNNMGIVGLEKRHTAT